MIDGTALESCHERIITIRIDNTKVKKAILPLKLKLTKELKAKGILDEDYKEE